MLALHATMYVELAYRNAFWRFSNLPSRPPERIVVSSVIKPPSMSLTRRCFTSGMYEDGPSFKNEITKYLTAERYIYKFGGESVE